MMAADAAIHARDREAAETILPVLSEHAKAQTFLWHAFGTSVFGPARQLAGDPYRAATVRTGRFVR